MRQLMSEQLPAFTRIRSVLALAEGDVCSNRKRTRPDAVGESRSRTIRVQANVGESLAESALEKQSSSLVERVSSGKRGGEVLGNNSMGACRFHRLSLDRRRQCVRTLCALLPTHRASRA